MKTKTMLKSFISLQYRVAELEKKQQLYDLQKEAIKHGLEITYDEVYECYEVLAKDAVLFEGEAHEVYLWLQGYNALK